MTDYSEDHMSRLPHPIPYQGSKRLLASRILAVVSGRKFRSLFEPFAGSAAITIAVASLDLADRYVIGDSLGGLARIWQMIVSEPEQLTAGYEQLWCGQTGADDDYYNAVRDDYNRDGGAAQLLYLLARCVKNSPRFNRDGEFNQSHDRRRLGMRPAKMAAQISGAHRLLKGRTRAVCADFNDCLSDATSEDLVYLDPPWEGTTTGRDKRYVEGLARVRLLRVLADLRRRGVPYLLSYDGRCGAKQYGEPLPKPVGARLSLVAGRSSQATLNGRSAMTVESLYVSRSLRVCSSA